MSLFTAPVTLQFTPAEWELLEKPIVNDGGHQRLLMDIQMQMKTATQTAVLEDAQLAKAYEYAYSYGSGGYQGRFKAVLSAAFRAGWVPPA